MEIIDFLLVLIEQYGYIIVFFAIMIESTGVPLPGETALLIAAAAAGTGHLSIVGVILCAASGAIIGDAGGYWVGRVLGRPFLDKHGKWLHLTPERMFKLEKLFVKHGALTVFFGRFFSLLRTYAALFAGVWKMSYNTFTIFNALGGIVWAICFGILGYIFGQNLPLLETIAKTIGWALTIPLISVLVLALLWRWISGHPQVLKKQLDTLLSKSGITFLTKHFSWQIHWVLRHWTAAQYTVIHITLGLIIAGTGIYAFVRIAVSAFSNNRIALWDQQVLSTFQSWATPLSTNVFEVITTFGSYGISLAALGTIIFFILRSRWLNACTMGTVVLGGQLLVMILKISFARQSPSLESEVLFSWFGFSFPSGHVMGSLVVYGMITYFLILWSKKWVVSTGIVLLVLFIVLLIGFSRIYLGENYLSDVLCGLAGGMVWLSTCLTALELLRRGQVGDRRRNRRLIAKVEVSNSGTPC
jgi:membrane protein DedA with SNARE-associated domain/membrane-associated phospholipid phosphatase